MQLSNEQTCLKVEGLIFDLCRFLKNMITFFNNKCLMYVLRLILKSDGKSWASYKVFKYNFYIGSAKKTKIIVFKQKKEKGHLIHQYGLVFLSPVCKREIQSKLFTYETRSFYCVDITILQS